MTTRTPRVFLASTFRGLAEYRTAVQRLVDDKYSGRFAFTGYPNWLSGDGPPAEASEKHAVAADYLILVLGGRYGSRDPVTRISITEREYRSFLFSHAAAVHARTPAARILAFQLSDEALGPEDAELPGTEDRASLDQFIDDVRVRHTVKTATSWTELQYEVDRWLEALF